MLMRKASCTGESHAGGLFGVKCEAQGDNGSRKSEQDLRRRAAASAEIKEQVWE